MAVEAKRAKPTADDLIEIAHLKSGRAIDRQAFRLFIDALDCCVRKNDRRQQRPQDVVGRMWQMCHREHGAMAAVVWRRWGLGSQYALAWLVTWLAEVGLIVLGDDRPQEFQVPVSIDASTETVIRNRLREIRRGR